MVTSIVANQIKNADPQKVANILGKINAFAKKNVKNPKFANAISKVNSAAQKRAAGVKATDTAMVRTVTPSRAPATKAAAPAKKVPVKQVNAVKTETVIPANVLMPNPNSPTEYYEVFGQRFNKKTVNVLGTLAGMAVAFGVGHKVTKRRA